MHFALKHTTGKSTLSEQCSITDHPHTYAQVFTDSSSHMRVMNHNWSPTKQRLHPQSVAEISRHSVLSGDRIQQLRHRLGLATRTQISVCKSPFPFVGTTVSLFRVKTVQQRPPLSKKFYRIL